MKARPRKPPEKDRGYCGPPPEQWKCYGGVPSVYCPATSALRNCCFNRCAWTVTKTMSVVLLLMNNLDNAKRKRSNLLLPTHDLFCGANRLNVQPLHHHPLRLDLSVISFDLVWNPVSHGSEWPQLYQALVVVVVWGGGGGKGGSQSVKSSPVVVYLAALSGLLLQQLWGTKSQ